MCKYFPCSSSVNSVINPEFKVSLSCQASSTSLNCPKRLRSVVEVAQWQFCLACARPWVQSLEFFLQMNILIQPENCCCCQLQFPNALWFVSFGNVIDQYPTRISHILPLLNQTSPTTDVIIKILLPQVCPLELFTTQNDEFL